MTDVIDISIRVQHESVLATASVDGVSMQPVFASDKLNRVGELINQLIDDTLIQARVAREQQEQLAAQANSCETAGCELESPADGETSPPSPPEEETASTGQPPLTLLNFG